MINDWEKYSSHNNVSGPGTELATDAENALGPRTVIVGRCMRAVYS